VEDFEHVDVFLLFTSLFISAGTPP